MTFLNILLTGFSLAMDAFAVSITKGITLKKITPFLCFKIAFSFGLFQGSITFLGWLLGIKFQMYIISVDHWVASILLCLIAFKMLFDAYDDNKNPELTVTCDDELSNKELIVLSFATSVDALAVGISFAFLNVDILSLCFSIGIITFILCFFGVIIGKFIGPIFKNFAQVLGSIILIFIALNILNEHTHFIYRMIN